MGSVVELLKREPVRVYLYGVIVALVALLVGTSILTAAVAPLVLALAAAVLAVPAVEGARSQVTPMRKLDRATRHVIEHGDE